MSKTSRRHIPSTLALVAGLAMTIGAARLDRAAHASPPEPSSACEGQELGAACSLVLGGHTVHGRCGSDPDGRLVCQPRPPPPPAAAVTACDARREGDGCSVALGPFTVSGTCAVTDDGRLACRPREPR